MSTTIAVRVAFLSVAVLVLGACRSSGDAPAGSVPATPPVPVPTTSSPSSPPSSEAPTSTAVPTTGSPATTSTTSNPPTTSGSPTNDLAEGSGCTPGRESGLPDGYWYGSVASTAGDSIAFDLACWFSGEAAATAAAEDGQESPPPNDYYVRDERDFLRTLPVADGAEVHWYASGDPNDARTSSYPDWIDARNQVAVDLGIPQYPFGIWLTVEGGVVTAIGEQWVP